MSLESLKNLRKDGLGTDNLEQIRERIVNNLGEFDDRGGLKIFNPAGYVRQMIDGLMTGEEINLYQGIENDLAGVVAEAFLKAEFRRVEYKAKWQDGELVWLAPGHEGRGKGEVLAMIQSTIDDFIGLQQWDYVKRFELEKKQAEQIIQSLEGNREAKVMAIMPQNKKVYSGTEYNYITVYGLEEKNGETKIVSYPVMNKFSSKFLSFLAGSTEELSETELLLSTRVFEKSSFEEILSWVEQEAVSEGERERLKKIVDKTGEMKQGEALIGAGAEFLELVLRYELKRLIDKGDDWEEVKSRLMTAWELVAKNIYSFYKENDHLSPDELISEFERHKTRVEEGGFERTRLLMEIVNQYGFDGLKEEMVLDRPCGSMSFSALGGGLGSSPALNSKSEKVLNCGKCGAAINAVISAGYVCHRCNGVYEGC